MAYQKIGSGQAIIEAPTKNGSLLLVKRGEVKYFVPQMSGTDVST